ncbi:MAG: ABC transporter substrate-binding protein, partial [Candidatus Tectomicrobia bacterium]|nr:ABC transporter substrate-binding protein [Candidatus Tectomicrobia bacterium]
PYGVAAKNGFLLGVTTEATAHNVDWKSWVTFEFLDGRSDNARTLHLTKNAIAQGAKAILGMETSGVTLHIRDYILDEAQVPFMIVSGATASATRRQHPLFIRITNDVRNYVLPLASWLKQHPVVLVDRPRWACIYTDYRYGVSVCDNFKRAYQDVGEEIGRVPVPFKTVSKKKEIVQLAKLKPDFAVAAFVGDEAVLFLQDFYRFKVHQRFPLVMPGQVFSSQLLPKLEATLAQYGTAVGVLNALPYTPTLENDANQRFVALYQ